MRPQIKASPLQSGDPTFAGGSTHQATASMTNPTSVSFSYTAELYLGAAKAASSGVGEFTLDPEETKNIVFTLAMPVEAGVYEVFLDIWSGGELLAHYKATENVTIEVSADIEIGPIIWDAGV